MNISVCACVFLFCIISLGLALVLRLKAPTSCAAQFHDTSMNLLPSPCVVVLNSVLTTDIKITFFSVHSLLLPFFLSADEDCLNCTEECRVLGHSDRCWMPQFPTGGNQAEGIDYRNNMFVPAGMETVPETETYETVNPNGKKTFCTFGKERRDHTVLVANVKPYLKAKRALSPLLQEVPSASSSPTKGCFTMSPCSSVKSPADGAEGKPPPATCSGHYGPPDGQYLSPTKQTREQGVYPSLPPSDPVAKVLAEARSRISQEAAGEMECVLEQVEPDASRDGMDADQVVRDIDKLLQDCRGSEATGTLRK